jgi:hypothetical protein
MRHKRLNASDPDKEAERERKRESEQRRRAAKGAKPRSESRARTKPWLLEGIGRSEWYARRKRERTKLSGPVRPDDFVASHHSSAKQISDQTGQRRSMKRRQRDHVVSDPRLNTPAAQINTIGSIAAAVPAKPLT